jgi:hypothetical protein
MKIGYFSESPADQAALAVFAEGILGEKPERINMDLQAHGVGGVMSALDGVICGVHYNSDADGLVVVVDCDDTELHAEDHDSDATAVQRCRYCKIRGTVDKARKRLKVLPDRSLLKIAIGLAVPSIEAWYLVGKNHEVGEPAWIVGCKANKRPFTRQQLKIQVYGTDRPSLELETERATQEAQRIINDISKIESAFPVGFGLMSKQIRSWKTPNPTP